MRAFLLVLALGLLAASLPAVSADPGDKTNRTYDEHGRLVRETGVDKDGIAFVRTYHQPAKANDAAKPGGGGTALTDCASTKYVAAGWRFSGPVSFFTTAYAGQISSALAAWDEATSATLVGTVTLGSSGVAGVRDDVNQIDWAPLGAGGTIAVTTTWYYRLSGQAIESDAQYNTYYAWTTTGAAGQMDVQNIATHELGHTFGLDHPRGGAGISCLTMYAYGSYGETAKRTLGDGDLLGIRGIYGN